MRIRLLVPIIAMLFFSACDYPPNVAKETNVSEIEHLAGGVYRVIDRKHRYICYVYDHEIRRSGISCVPLGGQY